MNELQQNQRAMETAYTLYYLRKKLSAERRMAKRYRMMMLAACAACLVVFMWGAV